MNVVNSAMGLSIILAIVSFVMAIYSLYLNSKQAKVKDQMEELIEIMKDIQITLHFANKVKGENHK